MCHFCDDDEGWGGDDWFMLALTLFMACVFLWVFYG
jgi:hypothetical protein